VEKFEVYIPGRKVLEQFSNHRFSKLRKGLHVIFFFFSICIFFNTFVLANGKIVLVNVSLFFLPKLT